MPKIIIQPFQLKVVSNLLTNIAAGFILTLPGVSDWRVLTKNVFFVMVCIAIALRAEQMGGDV